MQTDVDMRSARVERYGGNGGSYSVLRRLSERLRRRPRESRMTRAWLTTASACARSISF